MPSSAYGTWARPILSICLTFLLLLCPGEAYQELSDESLRSLPRPQHDFDIHNGALLSPILIPRVPGTPESLSVLGHFVDFFRNSLPDWTVEFQNSTYTTPVSQGKEVPFVNFIAYRDPPWAAKGDVGRLTLVAHYDSKYEPKGFIGAIDSAAPCAMIMHAMRSIDSSLSKKWDAMKAKGHADSLDDHKGIQVLFLDGEEAFQSWTRTDSLYGARALAKEWDFSVNPAMSIYKTTLSSISLFVLLDLLGSKNPTIQSYYPTTHWAYKKLAKIEQRLRSLNELKSADDRSWFTHADKTEHEIPRAYFIEDDHVPFLARGVEVMHIIDAGPTGFPAVWHTMDDDGEHLDLDTVEDWSLLMTAFAAEWMELEGFMPNTKTGRSPYPVEEDTHADEKRFFKWVGDSDKTELS